MAVRFSCTFQGEPRASGPTDRELLKTIAREAFPQSPPAGAPSDAEYKSYKVAPCAHRQLLIAVTKNLGERDSFRRPVLTSVGCVLPVTAMDGPLRDLIALWRILDREDPPTTWHDFADAVSVESILTNDQAFARVAAALDERGSFYSRVASAIGSTAATIRIQKGDDLLRALEPAVAILPLGWIAKLHFASGSTEQTGREAVIATVESGGGENRSSSRWSWSARREPVMVSFVDEDVRGLADDPLAAVAAAVVDPTPWPGFTLRERYAIITQCIDAQILAGCVRTPFEAAPELDHLRRVVRSIEGFAAAVRALPANGKP
jgi:hypothetical protein